MKNKKGMKALISSCFLAVSLFGSMFTSHAQDAKMYYEVAGDSGTNLSPGRIYISTNPDLEDLEYASVSFPPTLSAELEVTGGLDTSSWYYGKETYGEGYPVDVIQRDSQFDTCTDGHLFYDSANGSWRYYCSYGGAQNAGPYYLYTIKTISYTEQNVIASESSSYEPQAGSDTIVKEDLVVTINIPSENLNYTVEDFTFEDDQVDHANGDYTVTLNVGGLHVDVTMRGKETTPEGVIDYRNGKITSLIPGALYTVNGTEATPDAQGNLLMDESWKNTAISIVKKATDPLYIDSDAQELSSVKAATPAAAVDYSNGQLAGLTPGQAYLISGTTMTADGDGKIPLSSAWYGQDITLQIETSDSAFASDVQTLSVSARPSAKKVSKISLTDTAIIVTVEDGCEYMLLDKNGQPLTGWITDGSAEDTDPAAGQITFASLAENEKYTLVKRIAATENTPASESQSMEIKTLCKITGKVEGTDLPAVIEIIDKVTGEVVARVTTDQDGNYEALIPEGEYRISITGKSGKQVLDGGELKAPNSEKVNFTLKAKEESKKPASEAKKSPKTADNTPVSGYLAILIASVSIGGAALRRKSKVK